jgi:hypothetical protein
VTKPLGNSKFREFSGICPISFGFPKKKRKKSLPEP